jgi:benzoylformate decarboxylase
MTGIEAFLQLLAGHGVRYLFGNPGTSELPLNDALVGDRRFQYILGLQEVPVMAMADGYAMASGRLGVVNLHICCGLGNAMGMLYNAFREGTPLLVTAGQQDRRLLIREPILGGDMVAVARPWTKWSVEVQRLDDLPLIVRRAIRTALTPPTGPVFLSLPMDLQREVADAARWDLSPVELLDTRVRPPGQAVAAAAQLLAAANRPAILAGSRVTEREATAELVEVAELLGAAVIAEPGTTHGRLAFPCDHPLYDQGLPLWSPEVRKRLEPYDVLLVAGMDLLRQYVHYEPVDAIPMSTRIVHVDEDPWQLGKNYPLAVGVLGDTRESLRELATELRSGMTSDQQAAAYQRAAHLAARHQADRQALRESIRQRSHERPMTPLTVMHAIARVLPDDVAVIEEAVTTTNTTLERLGALKNTTGYFGHRGWSLGWGLGCTLGVQLAWPDRPVLGILGEGAALYGIQGLWSAAHFRIPATFVVCNNAQYGILKVGGHGLQLPNALQDRYEGLDLVEPEVDMVAIARSLGVEAIRAHEPDRLSSTLEAAWQRDAPLLIDVPISRHVGPRLEYG